MYPHHLHRDPREMCPDCELQRHRQIVEVILLREELVRDIETDFHRLEKLRKLESSVLDDAGADEYTLTREIDTAVSSVVARLTAYLLLPSPYARRISTNHAYGWEEKNIYLSLPMNWPPYNVDGIRDAVHNYIVKQVEWKILSVALPQDTYTALCQQQAADYYDDINVRVNARVGPSLIHPTFLG